MGIHIEPNYLRKRVDWAPTRCHECGAKKVVSYEEWDDQNSWYCGCGALFGEPNFYPTEFQWEEVHWTAGHFQVISAQLGLNTETSFGGFIDPSLVILNLNKVRDDHDRETMAKIAMVAIRLGVDIIWG